MDSFVYLLLETLIVGLIILGLYASKKYFGIGLLYVFLGTMQFFLTILSGNVYNLYFDYFLFSPGSTLIFVSTLFAILLIFRNEGVLKVRSAIYGVILSNITLVFLSYMSLEQILTDNYSRNSIFLAEIFDFDMSLFFSGIALLYLDMILIILVYKFLEFKFPTNIFLHFLGASLVTSVFDSVFFFSFNFCFENNYLELMMGNMAGKVFVSIILSLLFYFYLHINPQNKNKRKELKDVFMIIKFTSGKN